MAKVKVKRKDEKGQEAELEVEEAEVQPTDERVPAPEPGKKQPDTLSLTEAELNQKLAAARREGEREAKAARDELAALQKSIADEKKAANDAAAKQIEALRKDLPEPVLKLLDELDPVKQLEWLRDPANQVVKQEIPPLPPGANEPGRGPRMQTII